MQDESKQATLNVGLIGHVAHGKSTLVKALSGIKTQKFKDEHVRGITIKIGYANAKIYRSYTEPFRYSSKCSSHPDEYYDEHLKTKMMRMRHVSFVDCPGHNSLMTTMLTGASVMDATMLLISAVEKCPQPQTKEHLLAIEKLNVSSNVIIQNKVDLVNFSSAKKQFYDICDFVKHTILEPCEVIPICAQLGHGIEEICRYLCSIPVPIRENDTSPRMMIIRSFNTNKPGSEWKEWVGGVVGGTIVKGMLKLDQEVVILPGLIFSKEGKVKNTPVYSKIISLKTEDNYLSIAGPGGLIGVGLEIDPTLTKDNRLVGQYLGIEGHLPPVVNELVIDYALLDKYIHEGVVIVKIEKNEIVMINIGATGARGRVLERTDSLLHIQLELPICAETKEKVAISRRIDGKWRMVGFGKLK